MKRFAWFLLAGPLTAAAVWAGEIPREKLDCRVYETKNATATVGLKAGNFLFSVGPEVTVGLQRGATWDQAAQGMIARYVELCTRYNAGKMTLAEYLVRFKEIDDLYREARELQAKLFDVTKQRAQEALDELSQAVGRPPSAPQMDPSSLQTSVDSLARKVEALAPIGRPLPPGVHQNPPEPMKPSGLTGTAGARPDNSQPKP